jgi:hypothetical protein
VWKFEDREHVYFDDVPGLFDSPSQRSKSFEEIRKIIGGSNKKDLFHYETALANGCQCIISNDKDIYSHKSSLEKINPSLKVYQKGIDIYQEILRDFANESFSRISPGNVEK